MPALSLPPPKPLAFAGLVPGLFAGGLSLLTWVKIAGAAAIAGYLGFQAGEWVGYNAGDAAGYARRDAEYAAEVREKNYAIGKLNVELAAAERESAAANARHALEAARNARGFACEVLTEEQRARINAIR